MKLVSISVLYDYFITFLIGLFHYLTTTLYTFYSL